MVFIRSYKATFNFNKIKMNYTRYIYNMIQYLVLGSCNWSVQECFRLLERALVRLLEGEINPGIKASHQASLLLRVPITVDIRASRRSFQYARLEKRRRRGQGHSLQTCCFTEINNTSKAIAFSSPALLQDSVCCTYPSCDPYRRN